MSSMSKTAAFGLSALRWDWIIGGECQFMLSQRRLFSNEASTSGIYTLSLHDALPICARPESASPAPVSLGLDAALEAVERRSEEHTSELQSLTNIVCRLLLEKKNERKARKSSRDRCLDGSQASRRKTTWTVVAASSTS